MWERGDKALVFSGVVDSSGVKTKVEIGTIEEVGEYELMISFRSNKWSGPSRIHKDRCMPIVRSFHTPPAVPLPEIGDLVMVTKWDVVSRDATKKLGTIQSIVYGTSEPQAEILFADKIENIKLRDCFIIQSHSKKTLDPHQECYINSINQADEEIDEKIERTKTSPSQRNS